MCNFWFLRKNLTRNWLKPRSTYPKTNRILNSTTVVQKFAIPEFNTRGRHSSGPSGPDFSSSRIGMSPILSSLTYPECVIPISISPGTDFLRFLCNRALPGTGCLRYAPIPALPSFSFESFKLWYKINFKIILIKCNLKNIFYHKNWIWKNRD